MYCLLFMIMTCSAKKCKSHNIWMSYGQFCSNLQYIFSAKRVFYLYLKPFLGPFLALKSNSHPPLRHQQVKFFVYLIFYVQAIINCRSPFKNLTFTFTGALMYIHMWGYNKLLNFYHCIFFLCPNSKWSKVPQWRGFMSNHCMKSLNFVIHSDWIPFWK